MLFLIILVLGIANSLACQTELNCENCQFQNCYFVEYTKNYFICSETLSPNLIGIVPNCENHVGNVQYPEIVKKIESEIDWQRRMIEMLNQNISLSLGKKFVPEIESPAAATEKMTYNRTLSGEKEDFERFVSTNATEPIFHGTENGIEKDTIISSVRISMNETVGIHNDARLSENKENGDIKRTNVQRKLVNPTKPSEMVKLFQNSFGIDVVGQKFYWRLMKNYCWQLLLFKRATKRDKQQKRIIRYYELRNPWAMNLTQCEKVIHEQKLERAKNLCKNCATRFN